VYRPVKTIRQQRGAVAIIVGISIFVLIGMIGLALDLGRMFVIKTELQNAAEACALAAARELNGQSDALTRADAAGILVGRRNEINFQDEPATIEIDNLTYSDVLNGTYNRSISYAVAKYAKCTLSRPNIGMLFMGVQGFGDQTVSAFAVATSGPPSCSVPIGICQQPGGVAPTFGLVDGQWYDGKFSTGGGGGSTVCVSPGGGTGTSGNFNWIDFSPPQGGASELAALLTGEGVCNLPDVGTLVGQTGTAQSLSVAWNSRFGLYKSGAGNPSATTARPDYTGVAYTNSDFPGSVPAGKTETWPTRAGGSPGDPPQAYDGTTPTGAPINNYLTESGPTRRTPYQMSDNPAAVSNPYTALPPTGGPPSHDQSGELQRRIVVAPVINCQSLCTPGVQTVPIQGYVCALMLSPMGNSPDRIVLEYIGPYGSAPCSTGLGPKGPILVQ